ncbi:hypothetical protein DM828_00265 [Pseudomonas umsongensis]|jgi:hypothetical protein|nr:hypothetical protein [Pseudomonas umsongensis]
MQLKQGAEKERLQSQHWGALLLDEAEADLRTCLPSPFLTLEFEPQSILPTLSRRREFGLLMKLDKRQTAFSVCLRLPH